MSARGALLVALDDAEAYLRLATTWIEDGERRGKMKEAAERARAALAVREPENNERLYLLLALFDRRDGAALSDLVRAAREGYERSGPEMQGEDAWAEFDALWNRLDSQGRLGLAAREEPPEDLLHELAGVSAQQTASLIARLRRELAAAREANEPSVDTERPDEPKWIAECSCGWQSIPCTEQAAKVAHADHCGMPPLSRKGPHTLEAMTGITPPVRDTEQEPGS